MTEPTAKPEDAPGGAPVPVTDLERGAADVARLVLLLDPYGTGDWSAGTSALLDEVAALPPEEAYSLLACAVMMVALETPVPRLPLPADAPAEPEAARRALASGPAGGPA